MAVAVDVVATGKGAAVGSISFSINTSGSNRAIFVGTSMFQFRGTTVSSVTHNGVALTSVGDADQGQRYVTMHRLVNQATGSQTVQVTFSRSDEFDLGVGAISFTGVNQTTPAGTPATNTGTSTTPSVNVSSATGDIVLDVLSIEHTAALSVGAGQTQRWNEIGTNGFNKYGMSTEPGAASVTMSWTNGGSAPWAILGVSVKAAPTGITLTLDPGSYSLTGSALSLLYNRRLSLGAGSYAVTGSPVSLLYNRRLSLAGGAYTLTGSPVSLYYNRSLSLDPGSYNITGADLALKHHRVLPLDGGTYTITGQAANLLYNRVLNADPGSYVIDGQPLNLKHARIFPLGSGSYLITGGDLTMTVDDGSAVATPPYLLLLGVGS